MRESINTICVDCAGKGFTSVENDGIVINSTCMKCNGMGIKDCNIILFKTHKRSEGLIDLEIFSDAQLLSAIEELQEEINHRGITKL